MRTTLLIGLTILAIGCFGLVGSKTTFFSTTHQKPITAPVALSPAREVTRSPAPVTLPVTANPKTVGQPSPAEGKVADAPADDLQDRVQAMISAQRGEVRGSDQYAPLGEFPDQVKPLMEHAIARLNAMKAR